MDPRIILPSGEISSSEVQPTTLKEVEIQKEKPFNLLDFISDTKEEVIVNVTGGSGMYEMLEGKQNEPSLLDVAHPREAVVSPIDHSKIFKALSTKEVTKEIENPSGKVVLSSGYMSIDTLFAADESALKSMRELKECESESQYESEEESDEDEEYESEESTDDEYEPPTKTSRKSSRTVKKTPKEIVVEESEVPSYSRKTSGVHPVYKCAKCSSRLTVSHNNQLTVHAMQHFNKTRFKCSLCSVSSRQKNAINLHIKEKHKKGKGTTIDLKNGLREALWRNLTMKCFPDAVEVLEGRINSKRQTYEVSECRRCYRRVIADDGDLFFHIVSEHSGDKIDYDDPEGVKLRFFPPGCDRTFYKGNR